jgi:ABC-type Zn uptake system ZnuABC Zn-binding protein ZnuA
LAASALVITACGGDDAATQATDNPDAEVVAAVTLPPYVDVVQQIGGDRVEVRPVVPAGVDGHTYEPTPGDVRNVADADLVVMPGATVNAKVTDMVRGNVSDGTEIVDLNALVIDDDEVIYTDAHSHGGGEAHGHDPNPHTWTNIAFMIDKAAAVADALIAADPDGTDTYTANRDAYVAELQALDAATRTALGTVPDEDRTLVVYHDSWSYFAKNYGFDAVGALQAVDFSEPSAAEMRNMVSQVSSAGVPGFFGSTVFPTSVLEQVASESGVDYVGNLSDDALPGEPGEPEHTYIGMMVDNVRTIVDGLGGDSSVLDQVDPANRG